jgi:amino acid transporter
MSKGKAKMPFAREATGLVREIGWFTAIALVMSAVIGAGINAFAVNAYGYSTPDNAVSPLAMVLFAAVPFFCSAVCLGVMSSAMPRSGGPYVIISRATKPSIGYLVTFGSWFSIALSVGLLAWWDIIFWGNSFTVAGAIYNNAGLTAFGGWLGSTVPSIALGITLTILIGLFAALGYKIWGRVVQILFIIPLIGSLLTLGVLLVHTAGDFQPFWDAVFGTTASYSTIMTSSVPYAPTFAGSLLALPGVIFAYTAFYSASYVGGEVKNPRRNMILSNIVGMLLIILLYVAYTGGLARAVGEDFLFGYMNGGYSGTVAPAILPLFAAVYAYTIPLVAVFIALTGALWLLNDLPPFYVVATRSTFAWAFDRHFPEKFADVSERFHSPIWSVLLCTIIAIPAVILTAVGPLFSLWFVTTIDTFTYLAICVSGLFFVKKFKSLYDKASKFGGPPVLYLCSIVGIVFWLFAIGFLFYVIFSPALTGLAGYMYAPLWEVLLTVATFFVGWLIYLYYGWKNKKHGIDVSKIYGEIPPE